MLCSVLWRAGIAGDRTKCIFKAVILKESGALILKVFSKLKDLQNLKHRKCVYESQAFSCLSLQKQFVDHTLKTVIVTSRWISFPFCYQTSARDLLLPVPCFLICSVGILLTSTADALKIMSKMSVVSKMFEVVWYKVLICASTTWSGVCSGGLCPDSLLLVQVAWEGTQTRAQISVSAP